MGNLEAGTFGGLSGGSTLKVLIADDNSVSRLLLDRLLSKWGYEVIQAHDGAKAWEILQAEDPPRLVILDWMMPGMSGPEVCREARKRVAYAYAYILLVTSKEDKQDVIQGLEAGADDYLTKPFFPEELRARIRVGLRILELEDKLVAATDVLQYKATHDELTGLLNRASIADFLRRELERAKRQDGVCGVILADLDHFKSVNDTLGHGAGDSVLREAAQRLTSGVRGYDAVGRYGGEEFLIVLPGCDAMSLRQRAENILEGFRSRPFAAAETTIPVNVSLGAACSSSWNAPALESIVRAADRALYRAKHNGRDRVELAEISETAEVDTSTTAEPTTTVVT
jgi:two-component system cell cycle response regulator